MLGDGDEGGVLYWGNIALSGLIEEQGNGNLLGAANQMARFGLQIGDSDHYFATSGQPPWSIGRKASSGGMVATVL